MHLSLFLPLLDRKPSASKAASNSHRAGQDLIEASCRTSHSQLNRRRYALLFPLLISLSMVMLGASRSYAALSSLSCSTASYIGAGQDTCTVKLTSAAPVGGQSVSLSSSNSAVKIPSSVTVSASATSATFTATVASVTTTQTATLTAKLSGVSKTFALKLTGAVQNLTPSTISMAFGNVAVNTSSSQSVVLTSSGNTAITISAAAITGTGFTFSGATFPLTLSAGQAVTLAMKFSPTSAGAITGQFSITCPLGKGVIALSGTGTAKAPTLSVASSNASSTYGSAVTFTATISSGPTGTVTFYDGSTSLGTGTISGTTATLTTSALKVGSHAITANWAGNSSYSAVTSSALTQVVSKATPALTWTTPAAITYGTALSTTQLNATSTVTGAFSYSPAAGTILAAGNQTITATFTPTDTADYASTTKSVTITVNKATPTITWATPAAIASGTALSSTQLNATASVAGTFVYSPAAGTVLSAGSQTLSVTFTPTDTTDYTTATKTVTLAVGSDTSSLGVNATSVAFGDVVVNTAATQTLVLSSTGTGAVTASGATLTGTGFTMSGITFPATLASGQTATLSLQFDPTAAGAATGQLTINSNSSTNATVVIALSGSGTAISYLVDLTWDAPSSSTDPVAGYNVYRSPSGGSSYVLLNSSSVSDVAFVDSAVASGNAYDYIVKSVDASGTESVASSIATVTIP
jgi:hypothetical protein